MLKPYFYGVLLLALLAAVLWSPAAAQAQSPNNVTVQGQITAVGSDSVTINGTTVFVSSSTVIGRNGVRVPLSALQVGDRAQAFIPAGSEFASKIGAVGPR